MKSATARQQGEIGDSVLLGNSPREMPCVHSCAVYKSKQDAEDLAGSDVLVTSPSQCYKIQLNVNPTTGMKCNTSTTEKLESW